MRKKSKIKPILITFLILALIGSGVFGYFQYDANQKANASIEELNKEISENSKTAWVALSEIKKGETIEQGVNIELRPIYTGIPALQYFEPTSDEVSVAITDIPEGIPVMSNMVTGSVPKPDVRAVEISTVNLMTTQADYDSVDVRISFPDGSDYVVLAKKKVTNLDLVNCIFTVEANEAEMQMMTSAILDTYLTEGARMYTVRYTEENLQDAAVENYPVKPATLSLLNKASNVNISELISKATLELNKQARNSLEERLGLITEEQAQQAKAAWTEVQQSYIQKVQQAAEEEEE